MTIRVANKRTHKPTDDDLYIGRPSVWGNPFVIGRDGSRDAVITSYAAWIKDQPELLKRLPELWGKTLVCWCAPQPCHGHVLQLLCESLGIDDAE